MPVAKLLLWIEAHMGPMRWPGLAKPGLNIWSWSDSRKSMACSPLMWRTNRLRLAIAYASYRITPAPWPTWPTCCSACAETASRRCSTCWSAAAVDDSRRLPANRPILRAAKPRHTGRLDSEEWHVGDGFWRAGWSGDERDVDPAIEDVRVADRPQPDPRLIFVEHIADGAVD